MPLIYTLLFIVLSLVGCFFAIYIPVGLHWLVDEVRGKNKETTIRVMEAYDVGTINRKHDIYECSLCDKTWVTFEETGQHRANVTHKRKLKVYLDAERKRWQEE